MLNCQKIIACAAFYSLLFIAADTAYGDFKTGFDQGIKTASSLKGRAMGAIQNFKPQNIIKNYSENPQEIHYKNDPDAIKSDAVSTRDHDTTARTIRSSAVNPHQFNITANSTFIKNITQKANDIYDVATDQYQDCTKKTSCKITYKTEICKEAPKNIYRFCKKTLDINLVPHQVDTHYYLTAYLSVNRHHYAGISVNAVNGRVNFLGPHDASFSLEGNLPSGIDCHALQGKVISNTGDGNLDTIDLPACNNGLTLSFHISDGHSRTLKIDMVVSTLSYEPEDHWNDDCSGFSNATNCALKEERCVAAKSTHDIQGISVTRDCWEKEAAYQCGGGDDVAACESLRKQGCEQIGSQCENKNDDGCVLYQQTFRCPIKQCTDVGMLCNGQMYCLSGDCVKQEKQVDPDFQKAVSALSATHAAAKSLTDFNSIFAGVKRTCDKVFLGFIDCCAHSGWGQDSHLAQCSQEEKDLGIAKENLQTVYVGEYCKQDILGICTEHRKAYCVFPSKLAQIIQAQGRRDQLAISFGDPENANCRGLTREEFAQLDFSKIDFSNFYADISKKERIEDPVKLNQRVNEKINQWIEEKNPHG